MTTFSQVDEDLLFPDSDGKPMADNTEQFRWIVIIKENLEILFAAEADVFIAGDLLWYPVRSTLVAPVAPDVMVVFGRPKERRGSYRQWNEDNVPPQVVFEIRSPSNTTNDMTRKHEFYDTYGVEEYYLYDPDTFNLEGWWRRNDRLLPISSLYGWVSPRLGIRFETSYGEPEIYRPDGQRFLSSIELDQRVRQAEAEARQAEAEARQAEAALVQERQRTERLAALLRAQGINPDELE